MISDALVGTFEQASVIFDLVLYTLPAGRWTLRRQGDPPLIVFDCAIECVAEEDCLV